MIASFQNLEQKLIKFVIFLKFPAIPAENSVIPTGNYWDGGFLGIPKSVALVVGPQGRGAVMER